MENHEIFKKLNSSVQNALLEIGNTYKQIELTELATTNYVKDLEELQEELDEAKEEIEELEEANGELEAEVDELECKLELLFETENLYDVQKAEILKELFDKCTLAQLENIKIQYIK
jgi:hypothetical protein